jgi:hypothetical protein
MAESLHADNSIDGDLYEIYQCDEPIVDHCPNHEASQ